MKAAFDWRFWEVSLKLSIIFAETARGFTDKISCQVYNDLTSTMNLKYTPIFAKRAGKLKLTFGLSVA